MYQTILDYLAEKKIKTDLETVARICDHFGVKNDDAIDEDFLKIVEYQFKNVADSEDLTEQRSVEEELQSINQKSQSTNLLQFTQKQIEQKAIDDSLQISGMMNQYDQYVKALVIKQFEAEKQNQTIAKQTAYQLMLANFGWSVRSHLNQPDHNWQEYLFISIPFLLIIYAILAMGSIDKPSTSPVQNHDQNRIETKITKA